MVLSLFGVASDYGVIREGHTRLKLQLEIENVHTHVVVALGPFELV